MKIIDKETEVQFCFEYFNDAIEHCFEDWKLLLLLYADLNDEGSIKFLKSIFENE